MSNIINEEHLLQFEQNGFMTLENVFSAEINKNLLQYVLKEHNEGNWSKAQIGKGTNTNINLDQRGDFIQWLNQSDHVTALIPYWQLVEAIKTTLNRNFYLGLNFYEAHMACYPSGTFYKKHRDRHQNGSTRRVSFVYYLNEDWQKQFGGLLNIFEDIEVKATLAPILGHCIVFLSELEHEVTTSQKDRYSITGWFHQKTF